MSFEWKILQYLESIFYVVGFPAALPFRKAIFTSHGSTNHLSCPKTAVQRFINSL